MSSDIKGNRYPDGWTGSSKEQRERWAAEAEAIRAEYGQVPLDSLHSFAIVWQYAEAKAKGRGKGEKGSGAEDESEESSD